MSLLAIFALYWLERGRREPEPAEPLPEAPVEKVRDADFEGL